MFRRMANSTNSTTSTPSAPLDNNPGESDEPGGSAEEASKAGCGTVCYIMITICMIAGISMIALMSTTFLARRKSRKQIRKKEEALEKQRSVRIARIGRLDERLKLVEERIRKPNVSLLEMARSPRAQNVPQLKIWTEECYAKARRSRLYENAVVNPAVDAAEESSCELEDELVIKNLLDTTVADARFTEIPTRRDTQAVLHLANGSSYRTTFNYVHDFYGNSILIGQAPVAKRMSEHWGLVLQENVGVIVWIGPFSSCKGKKRFDPYIGLTSNHQVYVCHQFRIRTLVAIPKENGGNTYAIELTRTSDGMKRLLTLIHLHVWPECNTAAQPIELVKGVAHVSDCQSKYASLGRPNVLVHCSNGVRESVSFVVSLIGRQTLAHCGTVDPIGLLDYVRARRYLALSTKVFSAQCIDAQVAIIARVLEVSAILMEKEEAGVLTRSNRFHALSFEDSINDSLDEGQSNTPSSS